MEDNKDLTPEKSGVYFLSKHGIIFISYKIVLNTAGTEGEISSELKEVILYLGSGKVTGAYSRELDEAVNAVKTNEDRRLEYMTMMIHDMEIREEARAEERAELLLALVKDGYLPASEAARRLNMTEREFLRLSGQYVAH